MESVSAISSPGKWETGDAVAPLRPVCPFYLRDWDATTTIIAMPPGAPSVGRSGWGLLPALRDRSPDRRCVACSPRYLSGFGITPSVAGRRFRDTPALSCTNQQILPVTAGLGQKTENPRGAVPTNGHAARSSAGKRRIRRRMQALTCLDLPRTASSGSESMRPALRCRQSQRAYWAAS